MSRTTLFTLSFAAACAAMSPSARAAESFDACRGFIASLPVVITTQGVWCLDKDLATTQTSGAAITIDAHNVTIDCNGYKLGGLAAGLATQTTGILTATDRINATVRGCNLRGFMTGVSLKDDSTGDGGHLIEDNRFEANTVLGLNGEGDGTVVRRNLVRDTGGSSVIVFTAGIVTLGTTVVDDNVVVGATPGIGGNTTWGLYVQDNNGGVVRRNHITGILSTGGSAVVVANGVRLWLDGNRISGLSIMGSFGLQCFSPTTRISNNSISGFGTGETGCTRPALDSNDIP